MEYYLAVDIGASSGRHILGSIQNGKLCLEEVYRFPNGVSSKNGHLCWDFNALWEEIKNGLKECARQGKIPVSMGIDTWAVDFVLLDEQDRVLGDTVSYRDHRTDQIPELLYKQIPEAVLYERTGIQKQQFNSIYQLMAIQQKNPSQMEQAKTFLMVPDYFHFLLTGKRVCEYTNSTTTQLVSPETKDWDWELIDRLGYPKRMFPPIVLPGTVAGNLTPQLRKEIGFDLKVVIPATHDTASAVAAVPALEEDFVYLSSGTWSLMGTERKKADCSAKSRRANFTNEGGYEYRFRYLKNIMGLWMIQSVRGELPGRPGFDELCRLAEEASGFPSRVDVNDSSFLAPDSMIKAVRQYCERTGQRVPETAGELAAVIYQSLAQSYGETVSELEQLTGKQYGAIYIVGGGCQADYLNRLTAKATGKTVLAGPAEATATGNLLVQMMKNGVFHGLRQAREAVRNSLDSVRYEA